jgi:hypothetical protein
MSPIVQFTQRDLLRGTIVEPAWYRCKVETTGEAPSKDGGSTNYPVEVVIVRNSDTGATEHAGVPVQINFNSKWMKPLETFLACFGLKVEVEKRYDLDAAVGKEIDVFVENQTFEGRIINKVNHKYRVAKSE